MRSFIELKPTKDRRVCGAGDTARPGTRVLRHRPANSLGVRVRSCARSVRSPVFLDSHLLFAAILFAGCTASLSIRGQGVGRPPIITKPPQSQVVGLGNSASFNVEVTSATPPKFQWQM